MSTALTDYWHDFIDQMIRSGRYNNRSEVIRAGLRSLEEQETAREVREFDRIFDQGASGDPTAKTLAKVTTRQKSHRKSRK